MTDYPHSSYPFHPWEEKAVTWDINQDSVVLEIGGFEGIWAECIAKKYNPRLYVCEPQKPAYEKCIEKLQGYNAKVFNFGLGIQDGEFNMGEYFTDGGSLLVTDLEKCNPNRRYLNQVKIKEIGSFLLEENIMEIDLCQMNIEGYEYSLLPYMIDLGIFRTIKNFIIQFHMLENFPYEMANLYKKMYGTHRLLFDYGSTLSGWERI